MSEHAPAADDITADEIAAAVVSRTGRLRERFPDRYDDAQWEGIARSAEGSVVRGIALRRFELGNHDEPDARFVALSMTEGRP